MKALGSLNLIGRRLGRKAKKMSCAQPAQFGKVIAKCTSLWSASARTGEHIPSIRLRYVGPARHWAGESHMTLGMAR